MRTSKLPRHLLFLLLTTTVGACGLGAAPKTGPVEEPVVEVEDEFDDDVIIVLDTNGDSYDGPDESKLQQQRAKNAERRKQLLAEMNKFPTWREKYAISSKWTTALDYQTWKPRKRYKDEVSEREALLDLAVREFLTNWEIQSRDLRDRDRDQIDLFSNAAGVQNMIAIALAMDQRNIVQDKNAKRFGFELFSVFGLLRDTLIKKHHLDPRNQYESTIASDHLSAIDALEWRMNAYFLWTWELMFMETLDPGLFENRSVKIENLNIDQIQSALNILNRANVAATQLTQIRSSLENNERKSIRLNQTVKSYYLQLNLVRTERAVAKDKDTKRKKLALQLIDDLKRTQAWMLK
jgi:hypothetical protein